MSWNYRLIRYEEDSGDYVYRIHEVYYDDAGEPNGWGDASVQDEFRGGVLVELAMMSAAVLRPVLAIEDDKLIEVETAMLGGPKPDYTG